MEGLHENNWDINKTAKNALEIFIKSLSDKPLNDLSK
jgi:hypothetical protein